MVVDWRDDLERAMLRAPCPWDDRDYGGYSSHVRDFYAVKFIQAMVDTSSLKDEGR